MPATILHDRYELISKLGNGVSGSVFKALDLHTDTEVAIKMVKRSVVRGQVQDEVDYVSRVRSCGSVVHPLDTFTWRMKSCMVMKLMTNGSLFDRIRPDAPTHLAQDLARSWLRQLVAAALAISRAHLVHGNITPSKCLIDESNVLVLHGFSACTEQGHRFLQGELLPSLSFYVAPESYLGMPCSAKQDVWNVGLVWYGMITGDLPWATPTREDPDYAAYLQTRMLPATSAIRALRPRVYNMLVQMLDPVPSRRPRLEEVASFLQHEHRWFRRHALARHFRLDEPSDSLLDEPRAGDYSVIEESFRKVAAIRRSSQRWSVDSGTDLMSPSQCERALPTRCHVQRSNDSTHSVRLQADHPSDQPISSSTSAPTDDIVSGSEQRDKVHDSPTLDLTLFNGMRVSSLPTQSPHRRSSLVGAQSRRSSAASARSSIDFGEVAKVRIAYL
ncbi:uncharacterized protein MONBRDRAFT_36201 [Monosiga brevicollis MX1]|uniref:Protein kinase domain-containing protein n=1 Tax=Monosiga brevicollis TaxID=81824 RepID=A9UTR0_MONBE|nr:uncharacterized protein MONBRDRAFT_36201 [Monosiga brevicollis MX1]EDQ91293.1 predicted protein [Monosiga brevicollis MX1]|eukprot:XP_001743715.1 hypothetical protein [Monosiga brevicollis MX1]